MVEMLTRYGLAVVAVTGAIAAVFLGRDMPAIGMLVGGVGTSVSPAVKWLRDRKGDKA